MTKAIQHLEPVLGFLKACIFLIKPCLVKLPQAVQELVVGLGGVDEERPFSIAEDKLVDRFTALDLPLAGAQPTKEGFQVIVRAVTVRPSIALEQARPALAKARADMSDHPCVLRTLPCMLFQVGQELFDLALDLRTGWARLPGKLRRVQTPFQFHQPVPLAFEVLIACGKRAAELDHNQQLLQEWVPPFC